MSAKDLHTKSTTIAHQVYWIDVLKNKDSRLRERGEALEALAAIGRESQKHFPVLVKIFQSKDAEEQYLKSKLAVVMVIVAEENETLLKTTSQLLTAALKNKQLNPNLAARCLSALGIPHREAFLDFFSRIKNGEADQDLALAMAIMYPEDESAHRYFTKLALDKDPTTREFASECVKFFCAKRNGETAQTLLGKKNRQPDANNFIHEAKEIVRDGSNGILTGELLMCLLSLRQLQSFHGEVDNMIIEQIRQIAESHKHPTIRRFAKETLTVLTGK